MLYFQNPVYYTCAEQEDTGMIYVVLGCVGLVAAASMIPGTGIIEILAPVVNSGSCVLAVAFISGLYTYRRLRGKEKGNDQDCSQKKQGEVKDADK